MRKSKSQNMGRASVGTVFTAMLLAAMAAGFAWQRSQQGRQAGPGASANLPAVSVAPGVEAASASPQPTPPALPPGTHVAAVDPPRPSTPSGTVEAAPAPQVSPRPAPPVRVSPPEPAVPDPDRPVARPRVQVWVMYAGQDVSVGSERITLPTGARLALKLQTNAPGTVAMYTVNPEGVASDGPVWSSAVQGQKPVTSPMLRLEGALGLETIRVQFKPKTGGQAVWQTVELLHL